MESYTDLRRYLREGNAYLNSLGLFLTESYLITSPFNREIVSLHSQNVDLYTTAKEIFIYSQRKGAIRSDSFVIPMSISRIKRFLNTLGAPSTSNNICVYIYGHSVLLYVKHFDLSWVIGCYSLITEHAKPLPFEVRNRPY